MSGFKIGEGFDGDGGVDPAQTTSGPTTAADEGKFLVVDSLGGLTLGSNTTPGGTGVLQVFSTSGFAINAICGSGGACYEASMNNPESLGFSCHIGGADSTVFNIDGTTGVPGVGFLIWMDGPVFVIGDSNFNETITVYATGGGSIEFTPGGDRAAGPVTKLVAQAPSGVNTQTLPDISGYVCVAPGYVDLTAANAALNAGDVWYDTTLKKLRTATA